MKENNYVNMKDALIILKIVISVKNMNEIYIILKKKKKDLNTVMSHEDVLAFVIAIKRVAKNVQKKNEKKIMKDLIKEKNFIML